MSEKVKLPDGTEVIVANTNLVSDGYHTFGELYEHRCYLFALILSLFDFVPGYSCFKTLRDNKGEAWDGWFIAGMETPVGQVTYHLPIDMWGMLDVNVIECNSTYDGHSSADVVERIKTLLLRMATDERTNQAVS